ncbi:sugar phosphate nucleotidyltransferase [Bacillus sp. FJAT-53060]|uniref:sugar phosphate nucleotidyltransferase n=1 Tax=Bacillus TaxID=1386 RepID=UPI001CF96B9D|nr:sugar phosphate nucleotidyltransferase [Bacillus stratosphericus]
MVSDKPALSQLMEVYEDKQTEVRESGSSRCQKYGMIRPARLEGRVFEVTDLVEKPAIHETPSDLAVMGMYLLTPSIFSVF